MSNNICTSITPPDNNYWENAKVLSKNISNYSYANNSYGRTSTNANNPGPLYDCNPTTNLYQVYKTADQMKTSLNTKEDFESSIYSIEENENIPDMYMKNSVEYNTLQNNDIQQNQEYLDRIQTEIASKNAVLDIYNNSTKKKRNSVKVLKVFFIFIIFFFFVLWAKAYSAISNTSFILSLITLVIAYIYYVVWTLNKDNIANMSKHDIKVIGETLGIDKKPPNKNVFNNNVDQTYLNNYKYKQENEFIGDDCECPDESPSPTVEEESGPYECNVIETNRGRFYYDHSAPKQRLNPPVTEADTPHKEYIQYTGKNTSKNSVNDLPYSKVDEANYFADPNAELNQKKCDTHKNNINTNEVEDTKNWTLDL